MKYDFKSPVRSLYKCNRIVLWVFIFGIGRWERANFWALNVKFSDTWQLTLDLAFPLKQLINFCFCLGKFICVAGSYKQSQRTCHQQLWEVGCEQNGCGSKVIFSVFLLSVGQFVAHPIFFIVLTAILKLWSIWFRRLQYFQTLSRSLYSQGLKDTPFGLVTF